MDDSAAAMGHTAIVHLENSIFYVRLSLLDFTFNTRAPKATMEMVVDFNTPLLTCTSEEQPWRK